MDESDKVFQIRPVWSCFPDHGDYSRDWQVNKDWMRCSFCEVFQMDVAEEDFLKIFFLSAHRTYVIQVQTTSSHSFASLHISFDCKKIIWTVN